jgi:hypothetical protein
MVLEVYSWTNVLTETHMPMRTIGFLWGYCDYRAIRIRILGLLLPDLCRSMGLLSGTNGIYKNVNNSRIQEIGHNWHYLN